MLNNQQELQKYIDTLIEMFKSDDETEIAQILENPTTNIYANQTYSDNWDGGQYYFSIYLTVSVPIFKKIEPTLEMLKNKIAAIFKILLQPEVNLHIHDIYISPAVNRANKITTDTRLAIFSTISRYPIGDIDFLGKLYDLNKLPSKDLRYITFYDDIHQHTVCNNDWNDDWWCRDERLNLIECSDTV